MASDFFSQPREAAAEPLRREEGRRFGESQELLDRMGHLLGPEQMQDLHRQPEPGGEPEEEVQLHEGAEEEVSRREDYSCRGKGLEGGKMNVLQTRKRMRAHKICR